MQEQNIREYETIRLEVQELKKCITDYMGFIFRGSGLLLVGLSALKIPGIGNKELIDSVYIYASFSVSLILTYVLLILVYKFNSHNFQAGYCKLLNKEVWRFKAGYRKEFDGVDLITWEWSVDLLRACDMTPKRTKGLMGFIPTGMHTREGLTKLGICKMIFKRTSRFRQHSKGRFTISRPANIQGTAYTRVVKDRYIREPPVINKNLVRNGFKFIFKSMTSFKAESWSWQFPIWVVVVFSMLNVTFLSIGTVFAVPKIIDSIRLALSGTFSSESILLWFVVLIVAALQLLIWGYIAGKMFRLMNGDSTVDAFYWRFMPIRAYILNKSGIDLVEV